MDIKENAKVNYIGCNLLDDYESLKIVRHWMKVLDVEIGWHYWLDLIWQIQKVKEAGLRPGDTVIDAGAGNGVMQYILASMGLNVISIDLSKRNIPARYSKIFEMEVKEHFQDETEYTEHIKTYSSGNSLFSKIMKIPRKLSPAYLLEVFGRKEYGKITMVRADLTDLNFLENSSIDGIFSTSAIEHIPNEDLLKKAFAEMYRVLGKDRNMFITTSGSEGDSWYHEPSKGWCFSRDQLERVIEAPIEVAGDYQTALRELQDSKFLKDNLASFYFTLKESGMPNGVWDPKYVPIGITMMKGQQC